MADLRLSQLVPRDALLAFWVYAVVDALRPATTVQRERACLSRFPPPCEAKQRCYFLIRGLCEIAVVLTN